MLRGCREKFDFLVILIGITLCSSAEAWLECPTFGFSGRYTCHLAGSVQKAVSISMYQIFENRRHSYVLGFDSGIERGEVKN